MFKTAIIASQKDSAGMNIAEGLRGQDLRKINAIIHIIDAEIIHAEKIDKVIDAELFIFASRHVSAEGRPSLSCHIAGNWEGANLGGEAKKLCTAPAIVLKEIFKEIYTLAMQRRKEDITFQHEVTLEATHHGPFLEKPSLFVEIGSDEKEWANTENGRLIASAIMNALEKVDFIDEKFADGKKYDVAVGIGGSHYCNTFNKFQLGEKIAVGHVCPKHALDKLTPEMLQQAWERTVPAPDYFLLDWKGLGKEKSKIMGMLEALGRRVVRSDKLKVL